jgi:O-antigen/teichoic acid export membrane protein
MLKKLRKDELVRGSLILIIMIGIFNILNYIFQISMARMLGPADYGVLAVLMSIVYIFGIPSEAIQTIISRYTSKFNVRRSLGKIKEMLIKSVKRGLLFSLIIFLVFAFLSVYI